MRRLEKIYSKSDRIIAKGKFTYWIFLSDVILALFLGGIIAVVWIFNLQIERLFLPEATVVKYLTETNLKYAIAVAGGLVLVVFVLRSISFYAREIILTEDKLVFHIGILSREIVTLQVYEIVNTRVNQGAFQSLFNIGSVEFVGSGSDTYVIRHIVAPDRFARRVMAQATALRKRPF